MTGTTGSAVAALWAKYRTRMFERLDRIEAVLHASGTNQPGEDDRELVRREAHKLAGSLGTFGLADGTELARTIELGIDDDAVHLSLLRDATCRLRTLLEAHRPG